MDCDVGLSGNTIGVGIAVVHVALGATVIDKGFSLSHAKGGVESTFSLEPQELNALLH